MRWDEKRARKSERRWIYLTAALLLVPLLLLGGLLAVPYVRSWTAWSEQVSSARDIQDYTAVSEGATYQEIVNTLGPPSSSGPSFTGSNGIQAGVYRWDSKQGEIRGLLVRDRLVGSLKVGEWK